MEAPTRLYRNLMGVQGHKARSPRGLVITRYVPADASDKITIIFQYLSNITKVVIVVVVSKSTTKSRKKSANSY